MQTLPVHVPAAPTAYERRALREIALWRTPDASWFGRLTDRIDRTAARVTDLARHVPGVDWVIDEFAAGVLRVINEVAQESVWEDRVLARYRSAGTDVRGRGDVLALPLEAVDQSLAGLAPKYRAAAALEGAATGYAGLAGIVPDLVALVALNLRAAGEVAVHCGFDLRDPEERLFALLILDAVSGPSDAAKEVALAPVLRVSQRLARDGALQAVEGLALTRALQNAARALGVQLTRAKLAQVVPVTGAVVGSTYNAFYTSKVCDAAFYLYRERFLVAKYGEDAVRAVMEA